MIIEDDATWEALGNEEMCEDCPGLNRDDTPWLKRQPCPVHLGMSETTTP